MVFLNSHPRPKPYNPDPQADPDSYTIANLQIADPSSDHLRLEHSEAEREAAADIAQRFAVEICDLLRRMPRSLLLLLKTNDCLRSVDYALGTVREPFTPVLSARGVGKAQVGIVCAIVHYTDSHKRKFSLRHGQVGMLQLHSYRPRNAVPAALARPCTPLQPVFVTLRSRSTRS